MFTLCLSHFADNIQWQVLGLQCSIFRANENIVLEREMVTVLSNDRWWMLYGI